MIVQDICNSCNALYEADDTNTITGGANSFVICCPHLLIDENAKYPLLVKIRCNFFSSFKVKVPLNSIQRSLGDPKAQEKNPCLKMSNNLRCESFPEGCKF